MSAAWGDDLASWTSPKTIDVALPVGRIRVVGIWVGVQPLLAVPNARYD